MAEYQTGSIIRDSLHALSRLPGDVYELDYLKVCLQDMNVLVEAAALTPLGHNGQVVLRHVAHEQQDVDMSCLPVTSSREEEEITKTKIRLKFAKKTTATVKMAEKPTKNPFLTSGLPLHF